jgi:hypothetical protein
MKSVDVKDEQLLDTLLLIFEMSGSEGVEEHAKQHGLDLDYCRELLELELTGSEPKPVG